MRRQRMHAFGNRTKIHTKLIKSVVFSFYLVAHSHCIIHTKQILISFCNFTYATFFGTHPHITHCRPPAPPSPPSKPLHFKFNLQNFIITGLCANDVRCRDLTKKIGCECVWLQARSQHTFIAQCSANSRFGSFGNPLTWFSSIQRFLIRLLFKNEIYFYHL